MNKADIEFEFSDEKHSDRSGWFTSETDVEFQSHKLHYDLGELNKFEVLQGDRSLLIVCFQMMISFLN